MIRGIDNLVAWMHQHGNCFWKIHLGGSRTNNERLPLILAYSGENDIDESVAGLKTAFAGFEDSRYWINCYSNPEFKGSVSAATIFMHGELKSEQVQTPAVIRGMTEKEVEEKVNAKLDSYKKEVKIDQLEERNKELEQEIKDIQPTLLESRLDQSWPYIQYYLDKAFPEVPKTAIAVSGHDPTVESNGQQIEPLNESDQALAERIANNIKKWNQADPGFITIMERLATFANQDPTNYQQTMVLLNKVLDNPLLIRNPFIAKLF